VPEELEDLPDRGLVLVRAVHALRDVGEADVAARELVLGEHLPRPRPRLEVLVEREVHFLHAPALGLFAERRFGAAAPPL
jgi:hypothetical protein